MNKKVIVLAMLAVLAATPALAGEKWFGFNGGVSGPSGDFGDAANMGYHGTLTGTYMLTPAFGVGADLGYHWWGGSDDYFGSGADASFSGIQATAQGTYMIPLQGKARPYIGAGLGLYNFGVEVESPLGDSDDSSSDFGYNIGGGLNWLVSPMYMMGIGAGYHSIQTEGDATNFYTVGVNLLWGKN